jgi:hypothetical protein
MGSLQGVFFRDIRGVDPGVTKENGEESVKRKALATELNTDNS